MHQALGAIEAARAAGAADYASDEFRAAEAALDRSRQAVADRDYRQALNYALDARERAQESAKVAAESRARVRSDAERRLASAEASLARANAALSAASAARVPAARLGESPSLIARSAATIDSAKAAISAGRYKAAVESLSGLPPRLDTIASEIGAVVDARTPKRPQRRTVK